MSPSDLPSQPSNEGPSEIPFDFSFVDTTARIAIYDDLRSAPRIMEITPAETGIFIENLASSIYNQARIAGGSIPYTVVREVSENFIHARFQEIIVSIMDNGNTIRFADQGPGIASKEKAQLPGFSSAIEPMKSYIRGVGSGLPIVRDYLEVSHGSITIEDNLNQGSVVTISLVKDSPSSEMPPSPLEPVGASPTMSATPEVTYPSSTETMDTPYGTFNPAIYSGQPTATNGVPAATPYYGGGYPQAIPFPQPTSPYPMAQSYPYNQAVPGHQRALGHTVIPHLSENARTILRLLNNEGGPLRITDITDWTGIASSSTFKILQQLEEQGLIARDPANTKLRTLTDIGYQVARALQD